MYTCLQSALPRIQLHSPLLEPVDQSAYKGCGRTVEYYGAVWIGPYIWQAASSIVVTDTWGAISANTAYNHGRRWVFWRGTESFSKTRDWSQPLVPVRDRQ
jgi:hypothetical protein